MTPPSICLNLRLRDALQFNIKKRLGQDKKKLQNEDDEHSLEAPSISHTDFPPPSTPSSRATNVSDSRRASEPITNHILRRPPIEHPTSESTALRRNSTFGLLEQPRSRSADRRNDPLGLTIIHEPEIPPSCDIIFIHGLGGTSRGTWAKGRDSDYFWPQRWLPFEPGIGDARILSFGYNANFAAAGPAPITGIADFAKDLLHSMKYAKAESLEELELGKVRNITPQASPYLTGAMNRDRLSSLLIPWADLLPNRSEQPSRNGYAPPGIDMISLRRLTSSEKTTHCIRAWCLPSVQYYS